MYRCFIFSSAREENSKKGLPIITLSV